MYNQYHKKPLKFRLQNNNCFICVSHSRDSNGYTQIKKYGKLVMLSRFIYEECFGFIPEGLYVLHKCDNPPCVNPEHLFLGTLSDNMIDCERKNRRKHPKGEQHRMSKLTNKQVIAIRESKKAKWILMIEYKISRNQIRRIQKGISWAHLTKEKV